MPEGDTVWRAARQLHDALAGRVLTRSDFRVPRYATTDLTGRRGDRGGVPRQAPADPGGRRASPCTRTCAWTGPGGSARPSGYPPRDHRVRLVLANERLAGRRLPARRRRGAADHAREDRAVGHLGPDLLGPDWDADEAVRRLRAAPDRPVGEALLDQRNLAGIGNLYKAEMLFLRGVSPWRPVGAIGDLPALVELARRLLDANKERIGQVTTGSPARARDLGLRPGRAAVPPLRHADPRRPTRAPLRPGAGHVLVPGLPASLTARLTPAPGQTHQTDPPNGPTKRTQQRFSNRPGQSS